MKVEPPFSPRVPILLPKKRNVSSAPNFVKKTRNFPLLPKCWPRGVNEGFGRMFLPLSPSLSMKNFRVKNYNIYCTQSRRARRPSAQAQPLRAAGGARRPVPRLPRRRAPLRAAFPPSPPPRSPEAGTLPAPLFLVAGSALRSLPSLPPSLPLSGRWLRPAGGGVRRGWAGEAGGGQ